MSQDVDSVQRTLSLQACATKTHYLPPHVLRRSCFHLRGHLAAHVRILFDAKSKTRPQTLDRSQTRAIALFSARDQVRALMQVDLLTGRKTEGPVCAVPEDGWSVCGRRDVLPASALASIRLLRRDDSGLWRSGPRR